MRIGIASAGRFHVLDLARELDRLGHDVRFYSYVPRARARRFGLADRCQAPVGGLVAPLLAWERLAPRAGPATREHLIQLALDQVVAARLQPCDAFIFMSGIFLEAARAAKRRFGARLWLERGSAHVEVQHRILSQIATADAPSTNSRARELAGYALADRIVVPSGFSAASFMATPFEEKLFLNPYGVDVDGFALTERARPRATLRLIFVGAWSAQKGCDVLARAVTAMSGVTVTHVGNIMDTPFPEGDARFRHVGAVDQSQLAAHYAAADALVLPSRQEGFGLVLAQALATGLPVICTDRTGGPDLARTPALAERIFVVGADDADALAGAIADARRRLMAGGLPPLAESDRQTLSWRAYAARYGEALVADVAAGKAHVAPA